MEFLGWVEQARLSTWLRESPSVLAFPSILVLHAIGMGLLAGTNAVVSLRVLGFAPGVPLSRLQAFFPVMWFGLAINTVSGILLAMAYPVKAFTNPIFYLKLGCITAGLVLTAWLRRRVILAPGLDSGPLSRQAQAWAVISLLLWAAAITSGRFLAYTCRYLLLDVPC